MMRTVVVVVMLSLVLGTGAARATPSPERPVSVVYVRDLNLRTQAVWIAAVTGARPRRLAAGRAPVLSSDGRYVAYRACSSRPWTCTRLALVPAAGGHTRSLARGVLQARWLPDSQHLVVLRSRSLSVLDVRRDSEVVIAHGSFYGFSAAPSGRFVVYGLGVGDELAAAHPDLFVAPVGGGTSRRLTHDGASINPVWGPNTIAFTHDTVRGSSVRGPLCEIHTDGTGRRCFTLSGGNTLELVPVAWSKDGSRLLAGIQSEFDLRPVVVELPAGRTRRLGHFPASWLAIADGLARDGRQVLLEAGPFDDEHNRRVEEISVGSGSSALIAKGAGEAAWNR